MGGGLCGRERERENEHKLKKMFSERSDRRWIEVEDENEDDHESRRILTVSSHDPAVL